MAYDYDLLVIGLGPAGMAVSIMGSAMGLKVGGIEKHKVGGECMNVGCIPSKALLRMAKARSIFDKLEKLGLEKLAKPGVKDPFARISAHLDFISEKKTMGMFDKVDLIYQQGAAAFVDPHRVVVGEKEYSAKYIFICAGTRPDVPNFPGIGKVDYLTNENLFSLERIPDSLIVTGGGAIACEMAQAFARLGSKVTIIIRGPRLMWREDQEATSLLEEIFAREGITILCGQKPTGFAASGAGVVMNTDKGVRVEAEKVLVATGRKFDYTALRLEKAGVERAANGTIKVDAQLRTRARHIFAVGDCNGHALFSHAAMHQGMLGLMNTMIPWPGKRKYKNYLVPWTVFTDPQISFVGRGEAQLKEQGVKYETIRIPYGDYGAAIAEVVDTGFLKAFVSPLGRIYGIYIVGEGSGEMINEWALAIQKKIRLHDIMFLQHSFPTMGFLSKRVSEQWMMGKMKSSLLKGMCRLFFGRR